MLTRALIILLVFLNLGVAAWWLMAPPPMPTTVASQVGQAPLLEYPTAQQLAEARRIVAERPVVVDAPLPPPLVEVKPTTAVAIAPVLEPVARAPKPEPQKPELPKPESLKPMPLLCASLGPFDSEADALAGQARLKLAVGGARLRSQSQPARAYSVMAPFADRAAAQDMATRISAAGFDDLMVISNGPTSGVALGRYSSREGAQRRQRDLEAAGFDVRMEPVGPEGPTQWWMDVRATQPISILQTQAGASRAVAQDCAHTSS